AGLRAAELVEPGQRQPELQPGSGEMAIERLDRFRNAKGSTPTAELRLKMQRAMQEDVAVFRTGETLVSGQKRIADVVSGIPDVRVSDRSLIWNSDRIETLEFDNLIVQAVATVEGAVNRQESRGAHAREDFPDRDDQNWMKHTLCWVDENGKPAIDYRPVHAYTLSNDIEYITPKARVY
ncbi:MAG: succinate dehydrogenase/fumarate reductase flavoprotein subunit, partial [Parvibaculum sp.]